jgi:hypothetical protein
LGLGVRGRGRRYPRTARGATSRTHTERACDRSGCSRGTLDPDTGAEAHADPKAFQYTEADPYTYADQYTEDADAHQDADAQ